METNTNETLEFILFSLGEEECALPLAAVREIIEYPEIMPVPGLSDSIKGVANLRGEVVTILDIEHHFGHEQKTKKRHAIIAEKEGGEMFGMLIDDAKEVLRTNKENVHDVPELLKKHKKSEYLQGVIVLDEDNEKERLILLFDLQTLLQDFDPASSPQTS